MGLFFNFDKVGPGIDKDAPKKKGIFLYTELFFRKFWLLVKANMLYFSVSLPVMAIYNIIIINALTAVLPQEMRDSTWQLSLIFTAIITILWGTGPVSGGYVYILRSFAREEHIWLFSDFFEKSRETFKLGITVMICDIFVLIFGINAVSVYYEMAGRGVAFARYAMAASLIVFVIYTFMHYYIYELSVTFENSITKTLTNAIAISIVTLPQNIVLTAFITVLTMVFFDILTPFSIILLLFLFWISFMRFPVDFYAARMIKRKFIDTNGSEESDK